MGETRGGRIADDSRRLQKHDLTTLLILDVLVQRLRDTTDVYDNSKQ